MAEFCARAWNFFHRGGGGGEYRREAGLAQTPQREDRTDPRRGEEVWLEVTDCGRQGARLGVTAPDDVRILRSRRGACRGRRGSEAAGAWAAIRDPDPSPLYDLGPRENVGMLHGHLTASRNGAAVSAFSQNCPLRVRWNRRPLCHRLGPLIDAHVRAAATLFHSSQHFRNEPGERSGSVRPWRTAQGGDLARRPPAGAAGSHRYANVHHRHTPRLASRLGKWQVTPSPRARIKCRRGAERVTPPRSAPRRGYTTWAIIPSAG